MTALTNAVTVGSGTDAEDAARLLDNLLDTEGRLLFWKSVNANRLLLDVNDLTNIEVKPEQLFLIIHYAKSLADAGDMQHAMNILEAIQGFYPEDDRVLLTLGLLQCQSGDIENGILKIDAALHNCPSEQLETFDRLEQTLDLLMERRDYAQYDKLLRFIVSLNTNNLLYLVRLGEFLITQKRHEEALDCFRQILTAAPESPHSAAQIDAIYDELETPDARVEEWKHLLSLHPNSTVLKEHLVEAQEN